MKLIFQSTRFSDHLSVGFLVSSYMHDKQPKIKHGIGSLNIMVIIIILIILNLLEIMELLMKLRKQWVRWNLMLNYTDNFSIRI